MKKTTEKVYQDQDSYLKEIKILKEKILNMEQEIKNQSNELDQYENESHAMDQEITRLKNENRLYLDKIAELEKEMNENKLKINELNEEIDRLNKIIKELLAEKEKLIIKIREYEVNKSKEKKIIPKDKNTQFCELYKSYSMKRILKYKFEMIVGMFVKQKEKEMSIKIKQLNQIIEKLKKRNQVLTDEIEALKTSGEMLEEDNTDRVNVEPYPDSNTGSATYNRYQNINYRSNSQGLVRVIRRTKESTGNVFKSVSKITCRRRNEMK
jgi:cell division protein FtsB